MRRIAGVVVALGVMVVPAPTARAQSSASVEIRDNYFSPAEIHIAEGGSVTWTDVGGAHSVTSDDGVSFDSSPGCIAGLGCMRSGDTFTHQFGSPETVTYHCRVHAAMVGTVVVEPAVTTTSSTVSTTTTTTTTVATTTTTDAGGVGGSGQPTTTQFPLPSPPSASRSVALPRAIERSSHQDDVRPWALVAVAIAGCTTTAGIILVRRGRVSLG